MSDSHPQISILISFYNEESNIDACFESISKQTYQDFKIICVDDCSNDKSLDKVNRWKETLGQQKLILIRNTENIGLTKSLNKALSRVDTKYVARIDPDDRWEPEKLALQIDFMENHSEYGLIGCNYTNLYTHSGNKKFITLPESNDEIREKMFRRNPFAHSCILARTDLIKKVGGYNEKIRYGQDYDLWLRCLPYSKFYNLQEFLCARTIENGISVNKQDAQMWQSIKTRAKYIRKYHYNILNYLYLLEPLLVILTPNIIKTFKRRYL